MLMLRTYLNLIEAGLAKAFLDDHNIFCGVFDQGAHLYGGAPFAMPVRLVVGDAQFEEAARLLAAVRDFISEGGDVLAAPQYLEALDQLEPETVLQEAGDKEPEESNNPWEILAIAYLFLVPGLGLLLEKRSLLLLVGRTRRLRPSFLVYSPLELHLTGAFLVAAASLITFFYFYVDRAVRQNR